MMYVNALLVLVIAYLVTKLTMEYKELGQGGNAKARNKKSRVGALRPSTNRLEP
jgi:hypothetical protein